MSDQKIEVWVEAVSKLIALTQSGKLKWETLSKDSLPEDTSNRRYHLGYSTEFKGKPIRLLQESRLTQYISPLSSIFASAVTQEKAPKWTLGFALELGNEATSSWWRCPPVNALPDLLEAIQYRLAGVHEFLDALNNDLS